MSKIHVLHENDAWVEPLRAELQTRGLPYEEWFLDEGAIDLTLPPPEGVFYNRMSASSHTRDHYHAPELTAGVLSWLEAYGRRVLNGRRALQLEVSKVEQYMAFVPYAIRTPRTVAAVGQRAILKAAEGFEGPFITKHNRAGKGLGVRLFHSADGLRDYVLGPDFEDSRDGVTLLQDYIQAPEPYITRVEFIGGRFVYAVRVDTSEGFQLCPADACQVGDAFCPAGEQPAPAKFQIIDGFESPLVETYERFLADNHIHVAAFEFIVDDRGTPFTYDLNTNTNTNYNPEAESRAGISAMGILADHLGRELTRSAAPLAAAV
jgi:hypothetical protein